MYPDPEAEIARNRVTHNDIAEALEVDERTVRNKRSGSCRFFYIEIIKISDQIPAC